MVRSAGEGIPVRKLVTLVLFSALVLELVVLGLAETPASVADADLPDDEVTGGPGEAGCSSASAGITIQASRPFLLLVSLSSSQS